MTIFEYFEMVEDLCGAAERIKEESFAMALYRNDKGAWKQWMADHAEIDFNAVSASDAPTTELDYWIIFHYWGD